MTKSNLLTTCLVVSSVIAISTNAYASEDPNKVYDLRANKDMQPAPIDEYNRIGSKIEFKYSDTATSPVRATMTMECTGEMGKQYNDLFLGGWKITNYQGQCFDTAPALTNVTELKKNLKVTAYTKCDSAEFDGPAAQQTCLWEAGSKVHVNDFDDMFSVDAFSGAGNVDGYLEYARLGNMEHDERLRWISRIGTGGHADRAVMVPAGPAGTYSDFSNFIDRNNGLPSSQDGINTFQVSSDNDNIDITTNFSFHSVNNGEFVTYAVLPAAADNNGQHVKIRKNDVGSGRIVFVDDGYATRFHDSDTAGDDVNFGSSFDYMLISTGADNSRVTLPSASTNDGETIAIRKGDDGAGAVTLRYDGDNLAATLANMNDTILLKSDGINWVEVSSSDTFDADNHVPFINTYANLYSNGTSWVESPVLVEGGCYPIAVEFCYNLPPVAVDDFYSFTNTGNPGPQQLDILANDYDPNGDNISIVSVDILEKQSKLQSCKSAFTGVGKTSYEDFPITGGFWSGTPNTKNVDEDRIYEIRNNQIVINISNTTDADDDDGCDIGDEILVLKYKITDGKGEYDTATVTIRIHDMNSPLVLDLDGDGLEIVTLEDSNAYFDMDMDGVAEHTAWIGADDGWLVWDRNEDGIINDRSELFGDLRGFAHGFEDLAALDSDGSGFIDMGDDMFGNLQIWRDSNGDGISDGNELASLMQWDIASIDVGAEFVDNMINGQWESHRSTFTWEDGTVGQISDVWFESERI